MDIAKMTKCTFFVGMQNIARILISFLSFFMGLNSRIERAWNSVIYGDMYEREDASSRLEKNCISGSCISFILYRYYWDGKMEKNEVAGHVTHLALMKNVYTKSIWKLCGRVWGSHIGEYEGHVTCSEHVPQLGNNSMSCLNFHFSPFSHCIYVEFCLN